MATNGSKNGHRDGDQETGIPQGDKALQRLERCLKQRMDLRFRHFEERFEEIVERLDAFGIDAHRRQNGNRRPRVEMACGEPIDRSNPVSVRRQHVYDDDSNEEDDFEPNRFGCYQPYEGQRRINAYGGEDRDARDFRLKVDIPYFNGSLGIEDSLDWIAEFDRFLDYLESPPEK